MKHAIKLSSVILASIFAVVACEKETNAPEIKAGETITITATLPSIPATDPASKVDFSQGSGQVELAWSTSDKLTIIGEDTEEAQTFTLTSVSGSKANFTGTAVSGSSFTVLYPGTVTSVAAMDSKSFAGQTQTGNESLAHLTGAWTAKVTGLSDFSDVKFAAPAGGTFAQSGILKFYIQVPDAVSTVTGVGIEAPSAVFYTDNASTKAASLDMTLSGITLDAKHAFTAYMALSQKNSEAVAAGEVITVKFVDSYSNVWEKEITLTTSFVLQAGKVNVITLDKSAWSSTGRYAGGTGVDGDPWLITEPIHMQHMAEDLASGETKYFKLMDDVDMTGETWAGLNTVSPYDKAIDFDGNGHTISNLEIDDTATAPSFTGYLNGTVHDVTFDKATVTCGSKRGGVVAGYIGYDDKDDDALDFKGNCDNVTIKNATVTSTTIAGILAAEGDNVGTISGCSILNSSVESTTSRVGSFIGSVVALEEISDSYAENVSVTSGGYYAGGLIGQLGGGGKVLRCHSTGTVTSTYKYARSGGLIGYLINGGEVRNSWSSCTVNVKGHFAGGFIGQTNATVSIDYCYSTGDVVVGSKGWANLGGFLGLVETGTTTISNCYATGNIGSIAGENFAYRWCGGLIGTTTNGDTVNVSNCFSTSSITTYGSPNGAFIGNNASTAVTCNGFIGWSSLGTLAGTGTAVDVTGNYLGTDGTISAHATDLGWSTTIWDLSSDTPTLK